MFCHSVQEKADKPQKGCGLSFCCGLIGSQSNHISHEPGPTPFDVRYDIWQEGPLLTSHTIWCDMSHVPSYSLSVGMSLSLIIHQYGWNRNQEKRQWCSQDCFKQRNIIYNFNIRSKVWIADTVYATVCRFLRVWSPWTQQFEPVPALLKSFSSMRRKSWVNEHVKYKNMQHFISLAVIVAIA